MVKSNWRLGLKQKYVVLFRANIKVTSLGMSLSHRAVIADLTLINRTLLSGCGFYGFQFVGLGLLGKI